MCFVCVLIRSWGFRKETALSKKANLLHALCSNHCTSSATSRQMSIYLEKRIPKVLIQTNALRSRTGILPSLEQFEATMQYKIADEVDVEGLSILKALERICGQTQVKFRFVSRYGSEGADSGIVFYRPGEGRQVELNLQKYGHLLNVSMTTVAEFNSRQNYWPVTNRYIGNGSFKVFEATFDLIKGWDPSLEGGAYEDYSLDSLDFENVRDVYRKWCLNEAGDYSGPPYSQGDTFNFSRIFGVESHLKKHRKFLKALSFDETGESLGYYLEISYDDGQSWQKYSGDFNVLTGECGVWLGTKELGSEMWNAIQAGVLKFRITASIESDERLSCSYSDGPVDSMIEVIDNIISVGKSYHYKKVSNDSVFFDSLNGADEVDDLPSLMGRVRRECEMQRGIIEQIDVRTPIVITVYQPGDKVVSSSESRDFLGLNNDNRSNVWINSISIDFEKQRTELELLKSRILK